MEPQHSSVNVVRSIIVSGAHTRLDVLGTRGLDHVSVPRDSITRLNSQGHLVVEPPTNPEPRPPQGTRTRVARHQVAPLREVDAMRPFAKRVREIIVTTGAMLLFVASVPADSDRIWGMIPENILSGDRPVIRVRVEEGATLQGLAVPDWCVLEVLVTMGGTLVGCGMEKPFRRLRLTLGERATVRNVHVLEHSEIVQQHATGRLVEYTLEPGCHDEVVRLPGTPPLDIIYAPRVAALPDVPLLGSDDHSSQDSFELPPGRALSRVLLFNLLAGGPPRAHQDALTEQVLAEEAHSYVSIRERESRERQGRRREEAEAGAIVKRQKSVKTAEHGAADCTICCVTTTRLSVFVPCGHMVGCDRCADRIYTEFDAKCSVCNAKITRVLAVYNVTNPPTVDNQADAAPVVKNID